MDIGRHNMSNKIFVHDFVTGESYERDMTADELAQMELDKQTVRQSNEVTPTAE